MAIYKALIEFECKEPLTKDQLEDIVAQCMEPLHHQIQLRAVVRFDNPALSDHEQFVADMNEAGLDVQMYEGRFGWKGPAVSADSVDEVIEHTSVPCQSDQLGLGVIVYPKARTSKQRLR